MVSPDWLTRRGGSVHRAHAGNAWFVIFNNQVQYRLVPVPVEGKYGCVITQTVNGQRVHSESRADTADAAIVAGLDDLRKALGWNS
jgi:hypothetical protein